MIGRFRNKFVRQVTSHAYSHKIHQNDFYHFNGVSQGLNMIVVNTPDFPCHFEEIWKNCDKIIAADGGASRLFEYSKDLIPNMICGDLDSFNQEAREYYSKHKVAIHEDMRQDTNDLQKSLSLLNQFQLKNRKVLIANGLGGRFDQMMCNLSTLYEGKSRNLDIVVLGMSNVTWLLGKGTHLIKINRKFESTTCGLIPLGGKVASVTTKGLKYELNKTPLEFGGIVSTSNEVIADEVFVETSDPLIWTQSLNK